jgi:hypothetical protein
MVLVSLAAVLGGGLLLPLSFYNSAKRLIKG